MKTKNLQRFTLATFLFLCACRPIGTGTGNPATTSNGETVTTDPGSPLYEFNMLEASCAILMKCNDDLNMKDCLAGAGAETEIDDEIGITPHVFIDFAEIMEAERQGQFSENAAAKHDCITDMLVLRCDSTAVKNAYDIAHTSDPFAGLAEMFPVSCAKVF